MSDDVAARASFRYDESVFHTAYRASRIVFRGYYDTFLYRWLAIGCGHFLLFAGLLLMTLSVGVGFGILPHRGSGPPPNPWVPLVISLPPTAAGAWISYYWLYGCRSWIRRKFRDWPWADLQLSYTFTSDRVFLHTEKSDARIDWSLYSTVVEFRDGFAFVPRYGFVAWVPKSAFAPPYDAETAALFLRSKFANYRTIDREGRASYLE